MKTIEIKWNGNHKLQRAVKDLKSLRTFDIELKYDLEEKTWSVTYDENNEEQVKMLQRELDYAWEIVEKKDPAV